MQCVSVKRTLTTTNGWAATAVLLGEVADAEAWIANNYNKPFPGNSYLYPVQIDDEPWMENDKVYSTGLSRARKLTVTYGLLYYDVAWPQNISKPSYARGTTLKLRTRFSGQFLTLPAKAVTVSKTDPNWVSHIKDPKTGRMISAPAPAPLKVNANSRILIPLVDFVIEWDQVQSTSSMDYSYAEGKVNSGDFLGCDAGTLLFQGADIDHSTTLNPRNPHAYKVVITMTKRKIDSGGKVYGWNHDYTDDPPAWKKITLADGTDRYGQADFGNMFEYT